MAADGSNVQILATVPQNGSHHWIDFSICWPGDGSRIFFSVADSQTESHIYSVTVADGAVTKITTATGVRDWSLTCH
jgi:hypothetical protein